MPVLELIFLSPLLAVIVGALVVRFAIRRRPFAVLGWSVFGTLAIGAFLLPLRSGVWLPDFIGTSRTLATATSATGHTFRVTQKWNYIDFYTTTLHITPPDGRTTDALLDGDDNKSWTVPVAIDEANRTVTVTLSGGRPKLTSW